MVDVRHNVWIDSTFINEPESGIEDVPIEYRPADDDNIGDRSVPIIYQTAPPDTDAEQDVDIEFFQETVTTSGLLNIAEEYYIVQTPITEDILDSLVQYSYWPVISGTPDKNIKHVYSTGYPPVSGTFNRRVVFTAGNKVITFRDIQHNYSAGISVSGVLNYDLNYTNYSGNTSSSGTPIPFYTTERDIKHEFTRGDDEHRLGGVNRIIDVFFAGWVDFKLETDVYSVDEGFKEGYDFEVMISGGGVDVHYLDAYCTSLTVSGVDYDVYCSLVDMATLDTEVETIKGRIARYYYEVYSCVETHGYVNLDIDLFPIKITNFSLNEGEYTTAAGFISVDVLDDTCPISISGTHFKVDGVRVPVTFSGIQDGYRMFYNPEDNFSSLEGPTTFTAHAENECGQTLEQDYYLTFGYVVEYDNEKGSWQEIDYGFNNKVAVRVTAENWASCPQTSSLAWDFESRELHNQDLGASITGKFYDYSVSDISAEIRPQSNAYFYGKHFTVVVNAKDFAGNSMEPLVLTYRIEDKPEK